MGYPTSTRHRRTVLFGVLATLAVLSSLFVTKNIDFRVYWYGGGAFVDGLRPLYGPGSGLGFPMHYRYPPATYFLLWPLSRLPLYWAGVAWMMGAWLAAIGAVGVAVRTAHLRFRPDALAVTGAYMFVYVVLSVRSGNIQPYLIALILAALFLADSHHVTASALMALAITFKLWPVFFLPWFLHPRRRKVLVWLIPTMIFIWLIPLLRWTPCEYLDLVHQWYRSEVSAATTNSEIWYFPGQSLRAILLRYLTSAEPWIKGFPDVHLFSLPQGPVVAVWLATSGVFYLATCLAMLHSDGSKHRIWDGVAFALFTVLQPFCARSGMISLGPAVMIAAALYSRGAHDLGLLNARHRAARLLVLGAGIVSVLGAIVQIKPFLRWFLALGMDFFGALMLLAALILWALPRRVGGTTGRAVPCGEVVPASAGGSSCGEKAENCQGPSGR